MEASQSADKWGIAIPLARAIAQRGSKPADQVHFLPSPRQVAGQVPGGPLTKTHESPDTRLLCNAGKDHGGRWYPFCPHTYFGIGANVPGDAAGLVA
ncbi:hypothetical protein J3E68DRAFT_426843 [Trichoderma sp. SZMC 28012]